MERVGEARPIDDGDRWQRRGTAPSAADAVRLLAAMLEDEPDGTYALRASARKDANGARWHVAVVYQTRGRPTARIPGFRERDDGGRD